MNPAPVSGLNRPIRLCGTLMTMAAYSRTQAQMREQCCSFADGFYFHLQRNGDGQGEKAPKTQTTRYRAWNDKTSHAALSFGPLHGFLNS